MVIKLCFIGILISVTVFPMQQAMKYCPQACCNDTEKTGLGIALAGSCIGATCASCGMCQGIPCCFYAGMSTMVVSQCTGWLCSFVKRKPLPVHRQNHSEWSAYPVCIRTIPRALTMESIHLPHTVG